MLNKMQSTTEVALAWLVTSQYASSCPTQRLWEHICAIRQSFVA